MKQILKNLWREEDGQDLMEYTLLVACVALSAVGLFAGAHASLYGIILNLGSALTKATSAAS